MIPERITQMYSVKVKTLSGATLQLNITDADTWNTVTQMIEEETGIEPRQMRMIFKGKIVNKETPLSEQGVVRGSVMHMVLQLRGG